LVLYIVLRMRNVSHNSLKKIKTYILGLLTLFFFNHAVYETMWRNMVKPDRPQMTI